jgi:hypothetical protein
LHKHVLYSLFSTLYFPLNIWIDWSQNDSIVSNLVERGGILTRFYLHIKQQKLLVGMQYSTVLLYVSIFQLNQLSKSECPTFLFCACHILSNNNNNNNAWCRILRSSQSFWLPLCFLFFAFRVWIVSRILNDKRFWMHTMENEVRLVFLCLHMMLH